MGRRHGDDFLRARPHAALPWSVHGNRRPTARPLPRTRRARPPARSRDRRVDEGRADAGREPTRAAWDALAEMGVLGILAPEATGGMALDEQWLVLLLEEAGYAGLPHPIVETAAVAMPLVSDRVAPAAIITSD